MFLGMFAKGNREESERNDCLEGSFQFQFQFRREKREGIVLRKLQFDMHNHKRRRSDQEFPPKCPTRCRFRDHFPPKSPTRHHFEDHFPHKSLTRCKFGDHFPPKSPTRRRFGDQVSHQISHVGPAHSFFLFWFLSYFGLV